MPNKDAENLKQKQASNANQELVKKGAKVAANAAFGPLGGKAVDLASKTNLGKNVLNKAGNQLGNNAMNPLNRLNNRSMQGPRLNNQNSNNAQKSNNSSSSSSSSLMDKAKSISKLKKSFTPLGIFSSLFGGKKQTEELAPSEEVTGMLKKGIKIAFPIFGVLGTFLLPIIAIVIVMIFIKMAPLFFINQKINNITNKLSESYSNFVEKMGNIATCGFKTDKECEEKEISKLYDTVEEVYDDLYEKYEVKINISLLMSTLTYYDISDSFECEEGEDCEIPIDLSMNLSIDANKYLTGNVTTTRELIRTEHRDPEPSILDTLGPSKLEDFKKNKKVIRELALKMIDEIEDTYLVTVCGDDGCSSYEESVIYWELDEDKYKEYLKDFIKRMFYNDENNASIDKKVRDAITDIVQREQYYVYLMEGTKKGHSSLYGASCNYNATKVNVVSCHNGLVVADGISLKDYVMGVTYGEVGYNSANSEEYYKTQMIAAKTFGLSRGRYDSSTKEITIKACVADQVWCDITSDCYTTYEKAGSSWATTYPKDSEYAKGVSGKLYHNALTPEEQQIYSDIYDEIEDYTFLDSSITGKIDKLGYVNEYHYLNTTQNEWLKLAAAGNNYQQIFDMTPAGSDSSLRVPKSLYNLSDHCSGTGMISILSEDLGNESGIDGYVKVTNGVFHVPSNMPAGVDGTEGSGTIYESGYNLFFEARLFAFAEAARESGHTIIVPTGLTTGKAYRTYAQQEYFYGCYLSKKCNSGNLAAAPGSGYHGWGLAADLAYVTPADITWAHAHASEFGLSFAVASENWHVQPAQIIKE